MKSDSVLDKLVDRERRRGTLLYEGATPLALSRSLAVPLDLKPTRSRWLIGWQRLCDTWRLLRLHLMVVVIDTIRVLRRLSVER